MCVYIDYIYIYLCIFLNISLAINDSYRIAKSKYKESFRNLGPCKQFPPARHNV